MGILRMIRTYVKYGKNKHTYPSINNNSGVKTVFPKAPETSFNEWVVGIHKTELENRFSKSKSRKVFLRFKGIK
jgi:hypothetical protein|tara:strand:- start:2050 stop:2271 length:222 start_codon:yes stop_codon:yes gene_type:complete